QTCESIPYPPRPKRPGVHRETLSLGASGRNLGLPPAYFDVVLRTGVARGFSYLRNRCAGPKGQIDALSPLSGRGLHERVELGAGQGRDGRRAAPAGREGRREVRA